MMNDAILYVEDEESDVFLLGLALKRSGLSCRLCVAVDGLQAIDYIGGGGEFADRQKHPFPGLVLLDLKLPGKSGFQVLHWIRANPALAQLPVIIYTSSSTAADRAQAEQLGATGYRTKLSDVNALAEWLSTLTAYLRPQPTAHS